ncbi:MAG: nuclease [Geoglossum umbratile]|nr:MAG: nuclease [Geoglossum umbratile]
MSKPTLAIVAVVSAASGAAATAALYSSFERTRISQTKPHRPSPAPPEILRAGKALATGPVDPAGLFQYGFPGPVNDLAIRHSLVSSFDRRLRNPTWVAEHITPESLALNNGNRKYAVFTEDTSVPKKFRAKLTDYFRSGYDRGHQVPAADAKFTQEAMDETFYLTNMCPQVGDGFNRDYWAHFEDFCRRLTKIYPSVRIVTGPLYLPRRDPTDGKWRVNYEVIGSPPNVAVPTHFYKVIFAEDGKTGGSVSLGAFVLPNERIPNDKPLADFEVPVEAVERASGLEFAEKLPLQRRKRLCAEVDCSIIVRLFEDRQKERLPSPRR